MGRRQFDMENANDHAAAGIRFTPEERIGTHGIAWHINDSRDVVGLASTPDNTRVHAFLWQRGKMTDLFRRGKPSVRTRLRRQQARPDLRRYLRAHGTAVGPRAAVRPQQLIGEGAEIFVCGNARTLAPGVRAALQQIYAAKSRQHVRRGRELARRPARGTPLSGGHLGCQLTIDPGDQAAGPERSPADYGRRPLSLVDASHSCPGVRFTRPTAHVVYERSWSAHHHVRAG